MIIAGAQRTLHRSLRHWPEATVFTIAVGVRLIPEMINGAVTGNYGYDPAVYYAAADSFIHGQLPYRDFVLLHPPGVVLVDAPFAWLGSLTTDRIGFAALNWFFVLLSATSAVLVMRVARRLGLSRRGGVVAGLFYALWFGSLIAEYEARLEPLGNTLMLCGLLALLTSRQRAGAGQPAARYAVLAGLAFGAAVSVKIWWTLPVLILLAWELAAHRPARRSGAVIGAMAAALLAIDGPFLLMARSHMWTMVVLDQLGRPTNTPDRLKPLAYLVMGWPSVRSGQGGLQVATAAGGVLLLILAVRAWRVPPARPIVLALLAQVALLVIEPTWFQFYADYVTVMLALVVGAACVRRDGSAPTWLPLAVTAVLASAIAWTVPERILVTAVPAARLEAAAAGYRCVMSDSPMGLIDLNVLSSQIERGCPNLVDVTGLIFVLDRRDHRHDVLPTWNTDMVSYLRSGDAMLFFRPPAAVALVPSTAAQIERDGLVTRIGKFSLYRVYNNSGTR